MKKFINNLKISHLLIFMTIMFCTLILGLNYISVKNLDRTQNYIHTLKNNNIEPVLLLHRIMDNYSINIVDASNMIHTKTISWVEGRVQINKAREDISKMWLQYTQ